MNELQKPVRWLDDPGDLPAAWLDEMHAYSQAGPTEAELARVRAGLSKAHSAASAPAPRSLDRAAVLKLLALLGLNCVLGILWWNSHERAPQAVATRAKPASAPAARLALSESGRQESVPYDPSRAPAAAQPALPPSRVELPSNAQATRAPVQKKASGTTPTTLKAQATNRPAEELALLRGARRALASAPVRTLELTAEHERDFPRGQFVQERELLKIEALLRKGDRAGVRAAAERFRTRFPSSAHLERVRVLVQSL